MLFLGKKFNGKNLAGKRRLGQANNGVAQQVPPQFQQGMMNAELPAVDEVPPLPELDAAYYAYADNEQAAGTDSLNQIESDYGMDLDVVEDPETGNRYVTVQDQASGASAMVTLPVAEQQPVDAQCEFQLNL